MRSVKSVSIAALLSIAGMAHAQEAPKPHSVPIYKVTVVERSTKAINYAYRAGPTKIDFRGTVLLPQSKGEATVESQRGRTEIDAKFENLLPTQRFGNEYLTYTLWAITPQGAPHNIGEIVPDGSNKAKLHVTTDLQAFALIVTAEPYSTARQPSNVVVMENEVRADTVGKIEQVDAKYELLPRGHYTWDEPAQMEAGVSNAPKVSMDQYEAILEVYEAQNATGIAKSAGADQYAPDTLAKAQTLLEQARQLQVSQAPAHVIVETAREAAQTAEDARVLAERRQTEQKVTTAEQQVSQAQQAQAQAEAQAMQARAEADAARAQGQSDRLAREQAQAEAAQARQQLAQTPAPAPQVVPEVIIQSPPPAPSQNVQAPAVPKMDPQKTDLRMRLHQELSRALTTDDTPRGLVVTVPDAGFRGSQLSGNSIAQMTLIVSVLARHPELRVNVQGYSDGAEGSTLSGLRAESVRRALLERGLTADRVTARGLGDSRPVTSNATAEGRVTNRRVEIVITGDSIGTLPAWDHTYSLTPRQ